MPNNEHMPVLNHPQRERNTHSSHRRALLKNCQSKPQWIDNPSGSFDGIFLVKRKSLSVLIIVAAGIVHEKEVVGRSRRCVIERFCHIKTLNDCDGIHGPPPWCICFSLPWTILTIFALFRSTLSATKRKRRGSLFRRNKNASGYPNEFRLLQRI